MSEAKTASIAVPSVKGMQGAFADFAWGCGGGLIYGLSKAILGTGLIGALAAPVLAGSIIKGPRGTALATIAGFLLLAGLGGSGQAQASSTNEDEM